MRPAAAVLLLAYRQADFVARAAHGVLAQACEPIEIILSDDASPDATGEILEAIAASYRGPHQVRVRRGPQNLGIAGHYNALIEMTQAPLLITAAGDDLSTPDRVAKLLAAWRASGERLDLIASHLQGMRQDGTPTQIVPVDDLAQWPDATAWLARRPHVIGAAQAFTRRIMERFGPFDPRIAYEDQITTFRAIVSGGAMTLPEPLVHYRQGGVSTRQAMRTAEDLIGWMRTQNGRLVAEMEQLLDDAQVAGLKEAVQTQLRTPLARARYLLALSQAPDAAARRALLREHSELPLTWRLRKFFKLNYPGFNAGVNRLRARLKGEA
jgi:glycosyltransferase involved in cell wall biosynthesis